MGVCAINLSCTFEYANLIKTCQSSFRFVFQSTDSKLIIRCNLYDLFPWVVYLKTGICITPAWGLDNTDVLDRKKEALMQSKLIISHQTGRRVVRPLSFREVWRCPMTYLLHYRMSECWCLNIWHMGWVLSTWWIISSTIGKFLTEKKENWKKYVHSYNPVQDC